MKTGIELITEERKEQLEKHGWTLAHDREHKFGELAKTAAALAIQHTDAEIFESGEILEDYWDLVKTLKNKPIKALIVAGSLIAAEIDRLNFIEMEENQKKYRTCGGCGATHPVERCIGCTHNFEKDSTNTI